ncbi:MAG: methyltransferase [Nitriliruptoraceae bacterium]
MRRRRSRTRFPAITPATPPLPEEVWRPLVDEQLEAGSPSGWFEPAYQAASARGARLPWQEGAPHPWLADWLAAPVHTPPGARALVVGCGVGDDVAPLLASGYHVTALDIAPTAIAWARRRAAHRGDGSHDAVAWHTGDLLTLGAQLLGAFDLVVEIHTVPWLPGVVRDAAMAAIGGAVAPGGVALVITELATSEADRSRRPGPPWPQAPSELAAYRAGGLVRLALEHPPAQDQATMEVRATWQRPQGTGPVDPAAGRLPTVG